MKTRTSIATLQSIGISHDDAIALRRISMTLHRWHELECGTSNDYYSECLVRGRQTGQVFEYDDDGAPYLERHIHTQTKPIYIAVPDRERGAKKRLAKIMARYPDYVEFIQTDPRGCALHLV